MESTLTGRLSGPLFTECAEWIWEQMQDDGYYLAGEVIELILETERTLGVHEQPILAIAAALEADFAARGISGNPEPIAAALIHVVLQWEDDFLGFAGISRAES